MITPDFLDKIIVATRAAVSRLNTLLIIKIAKSINDAFNAGEQRLLTPSAIKHMTMLVKSGLSMKDVQNIVEKALPGIKKEVRKAFMASAKEIALYNNEVEKQLVKNARLAIDVPNVTIEGIPTNPAALNMTISEIRVLEAAYKRTNGTINNIAKSIAPAVYQTYIQACDDAIFEIESGVSIGQAILDTVERVAKEGITVVQYESGRVDQIDVAIARAVRTGVNQANSDIILTRCAEIGIQYVKVHDHRGARVTKYNDYTNHSWWQGKVYSLDWTNPQLSHFVDDIVVPEDQPQFRYMKELKRFLYGKKEFDYPDFVETCGYGKIEGIIGINCRHTFQGWMPEYNVNNTKEIDPAENERIYKAEQKQRSMERQMRDMRRQIEALEQIVPQTEDTKEALAVKRKRLKLMGEKLMEHCRNNGLSYDSTRIR